MRPGQLAGSMRGGARMVETDRLRAWAAGVGAAMIRCCPVFLAATPAFAQQADSAAPLPREEIVVTATRAAQESFEQPIAIDSIGQQAIRDGQLQVNLSESLARVPGILVQ